MAGNLIEFVFRSDARSSIRAFDQIANASQKTSGTIKRDADENSLSMKRVGHSAGLLRESMRGLTGMIGLGGLAFGLKDAVQGGMALQGSQTQLQQALKATGQTAGDAYKNLGDYAEKLSAHGGFDTTQNLGALTAYVRQTHSATKAQRDLSVATNIARGRNMDLASAQAIVAQAEGGQIGRLSRLLGPLVAVKNAQYGLTQAHKQQIATLELQSKAHGKSASEWLKQQELLDGITPRMQALAVLQDKSATAQQVLSAAQTVFGGATGVYAGTTQGKISDLNHTLKNLTDTTGEKLLPAVNLLARDATWVVTAFSKLPASVEAGVIGLTGLTLIAGPLHNSFRLLRDMIDGTKGIMRLFGIGVEADTVAERIHAGTTGGGAVANAGRAASAERAVVGTEAVTGAGLSVAAGTTALAVGVPLAIGAGYLLGKALPGSDVHARPGSRYTGYERGGQYSGTAGALNGQMAGNGDTHIHNHINLNVDGRVLAKAVSDQVVRKAARGPSTLSGGPMLGPAAR